MMPLLFGVNGDEGCELKHVTPNKFFKCGSSRPRAAED